MAISLNECSIHPTGLFNNHAKDYSRISVLPLASAMGAEIRGVDLSNIDVGQFDEISDALYRHKMVFFRDQDLTLADQEAITLRFGPFATDAYTIGIEGHPNVQQLLKKADEDVPFVSGGIWHTDSSFLENPPSIGLLYAVEVPPYGGDTLWANSELAYSYLSDAMKRLLKTLRVKMSGRKTLNLILSHAKKTGTMKSGSTVVDPQQETMLKGAYHPLVQIHPVTGAKALNVNEAYSIGIEGMTDAEASALLDFLCTHITQPAFTCRLHWETGTFAIWDNRISQHHAFNDFSGVRREMRRTIVQSELAA